MAGKSDFDTQQPHSFSTSNETHGNDDMRRTEELLQKSRLLMSTFKKQREEAFKKQERVTKSLHETTHQHLTTTSPSTPGQRNTPPSLPGYHQDWASRSYSPYLQGAGGAGVYDPASRQHGRSGAYSVFSECDLYPTRPYEWGSRPTSSLGNFNRPGSVLGPGHVDNVPFREPTPQNMWEAAAAPNGQSESVKSQLVSSERSTASYSNQAEQGRVTLDVQSLLQLISAPKSIHEKRLLEDIVKKGGLQLPKKAATDKSARRRSSLEKGGAEKRRDLALSKLPPPLSSGDDSSATHTDEEGSASSFEGSNSDSSARDSSWKLKCEKTKFTDHAAEVDGDEATQISSLNTTARTHTSTWSQDQENEDKKQFKEEEDDTSSDDDEPLTPRPGYSKKEEGDLSFSDEELSDPSILSPMPKKRRCSPGIPGDRATADQIPSVNVEVQTIIMSSKQPEQTTQMTQTCHTAEVSQGRSQSRHVESDNQLRDNQPITPKTPSTHRSSLTLVSKGENTSSIQDREMDGEEEDDEGQDLNAEMSPRSPDDYETGQMRTVMDLQLVERQLTRRIEDHTSVISQLEDILRETMVKVIEEQKKRKELKLQKREVRNERRTIFSKLSMQPLSDSELITARENPPPLDLPQSDADDLLSPPPLGGRQPVTTKSSSEARTSHQQHEQIFTDRTESLLEDPINFQVDISSTSDDSDNQQEGQLTTALQFGDVTFRGIIDRVVGNEESLTSESFDKDLDSLMKEFMEELLTNENLQQEVKTGVSSRREATFSTPSIVSHLPLHRRGVDPCSQRTPTHDQLSPEAAVLSDVMSESCSQLSLLTGAQVGTRPAATPVLVAEEILTSRSSEDGIMLRTRQQLAALHMTEIGNRGKKLDEVSDENAVSSGLGSSILVTHPAAPTGIQPPPIQPFSLLFSATSSSSEDTLLNSAAHRKPPNQLAQQPASTSNKPLDGRHPFTLLSPSSAGGDTAGGEGGGRRGAASSRSGISSSCSTSTSVLLRRAASESNLVSSGGDSSSTLKSGRSRTSSRNGGRPPSRSRRHVDHHRASELRSYLHASSSSDLSDLDGPPSLAGRRSLIRPSSACAAVEHMPSLSSGSVQPVLFTNNKHE